MAMVHPALPGRPAGVRAVAGVGRLLAPTTPCIGGARLAGFGAAYPSFIAKGSDDLTGLSVDVRGQYQVEMPAGAAHQLCASSASKSSRRVSWPLSASATQLALPSSTQPSCASPSSPFFLRVLFQIFVTARFAATFAMEAYGGPSIYARLLFQV